MKICPYCAEEIQDEAIYCRFCNHNLIPTLPTHIDRPENVKVGDDQRETVSGWWSVFVIVWPWLSLIAGAYYAGRPQTRKQGKVLAGVSLGVLVLYMIISMIIVLALQGAVWWNNFSAFSPPTATATPRIIYDTPTPKSWSPQTQTAYAKMPTTDIKQIQREILLTVNARGQQTFEASQATPMPSP